MRLKSLELQGFKSFPDRTKLNFDSGMTVVIGPNGSGKSNIADAIRWVLGELSSKNIRGTKMEDVIFAGTDNRRPMGYAEVSLTFDNTDKENGLPIDYDEVTITRKYYRSGDSEYLINGRKVRLRDITELFMNTGLGKSGYSIIGQGRIAEIISKKSEDRRGIFEEAAGISKYRYRKNEAERDLAKTDDNLSRVTDILTELEGRVGPLEKDAEKARKYLDLYAEKKQLDVSLWLYEIDSIRERSAKLTGDYEISKHELEMAEDSLAGLERRSDLLLERVRENAEKSEDARRRAGALTEERHKAESQILLLDKDMQHLDAEKERLTRAIESAEAEAADELARRKKVVADREKSEKDLAACCARLEKIERIIEERRAAVAVLYEEESAAEERIEEAKDALQKLMIDLSTLEGGKQSENERRAEMDERISFASGQIREIGEKSLAKEKTLSDYKSRIDGSKNKIAALNDAQKALISEQSALSALCGDLTVRENTASERAKLLRRMEEHFEGYAGSVRCIMERAAAGTLRGIRGPVSKLISVSERFAVAVETALGASLQNIVTEDEASAKEAIEELRKSGNGRATFYPLTNMKPKKPDLEKKTLASFDGFLGIASDLVECDEHDRPVVDYLLCQTLICRTLDDAAAIARAFAHKYKCVSLDGQVVNAGGSLTGGSARKDVGILQRGREIARLEKECAALKEEHAGKEKELEELGRKISAAENEKDSESAMLEILNVMYASEETEYKVLLSRFDSEQSALNALMKGREALDDQMQSYEKRKAALEKEISDAEAEVGARKELREEAAKRRLTAEHERDASIEEKNGTLFEKGALEKDLTVAARELERCDAHILQLSEAKESAKAETLRAADKKKECAEKKKAEEKRTADLTRQLALLESEDADLKKENEEYEKESALLREQQKEKTRHREIILKEYTRLESAIAGIQSEQERYTARLWDEYELTYAASKELGYPAITEATRNETVTKQTRLRNRIRELGPVNVGAIEEYAEVKERYDFLSKQYADLTSARSELSSVISGLEKDMKTRFAEVFSAINDNFRVVFAELFGGGTAELSLTDPENILESGIEIAVAPPGKIIKSLSLLSGGEQVFVAIALFFAILRVNPAPFCLLDEIEAALDEVNVARFAAYARDYSDKSQFIIITHRRGTMEQADTMYGVTMGERGISKVLPLHLSDAEAKNFKIN